MDPTLDPTPQLDANGQQFFTVNTANGPTSLYPHVPEHAQMIKSLTPAPAAPVVSQDEKNLNAWGELASTVGSGVADAAGAVADAVKKVPTPAENMRSQFAPQTQPNDALPATAPVQPATTKSANLAVAEEPADINVKPAPQPTAASAASGGGGGGVTMTESTDKTYKTYGADAMKQLRDTQKSELDAVTAENNAKAALATAQQTQADRIAMENAKFIDAEMQTRMEEDAAKKERWNAYESKKNEYSGLAVDDNRFWNNASTGDNLMAVVAMAMAGMGAALQGRSGNAAWDIIDKKIDRDIDEQKTNIMQKGRELDAQRTAYKDFLDVTGDERAARLATKEMALQKIASEYEKAIGQATNDVQKASLQVVLEGVLEKHAATNLQLTEVLNTKKTAPLVAKAGAGKVEDTVLLNLVKAETDLDRAASILERVRDGKTNMGLVESWKQAMWRATGQTGDIDSAVLMRDMAEQKNSYVTKMFGASLTASEKEAAEAAVALFKDDPERAAALLQSTLDGATQSALDQRESLIEAGRRLPETRSKYLKTYRERQANQPKK